MRKTLTVMLLLAAIWTIQAQTNPQILIAYYSEQGHTEALAEAVAQGARSVRGVSVKLVKIENATRDDVVGADAIVVGSPVYNANVAPTVQEFINTWPFDEITMKDKIGAAFVTGGGISAGEEIVQTNILKSMLIFGMIVVGGPDWRQAFGASAITFEQPFDQSTETIHPTFRAKGVALGERVAQVVSVFKR